MDASAFDRLTRMLFRATSRRAALGALLTTAGATLGLAGTQRATAQGECTVNGEPCHTGDDCCSGLCKRKNNGKKICKQADNQGVCTIDDDACAGSGFACGTASGGSDCFCFVTTTGRSFCGDFFTIQQTEDCDCTSNKECERRIGKGAKCIQAGTDCQAPSCPPSTTSGCMAPCQSLDPIPSAST
jgi:hypothetical protein